MRPKLVLFGDSITEESFGEGGWAAALSHHFCRSADVVLRGYSGYNTRWAVMAVERAMEGIVGEAPAALTLFFGANDAALPDRASGFQHVPLLEYRENLKKLCDYFKVKWPSTRIILITPPPIDEDGRIKNPYGDDSGLPERTNESAGAYAKACIAVAEECHLPVIDIWSKMQQFPNWQKSFLRDGLHFTEHGNKILFEEVVQKLKDEGLSVGNVPLDLPLFSCIDPIDPMKSFE